MEIDPDLIKKIGSIKFSNHKEFSLSSEQNYTLFSVFFNKILKIVAKNKENLHISNYKNQTALIFEDRVLLNKYPYKIHLGLKIVTISVDGYNFGVIFDYKPVISKNNIFNLSREEKEIPLTNSEKKEFFLPNSELRNSYITSALNILKNSPDSIIYNVSNKKIVFKLYGTTVNKNY